ncbi:MAG: phosphodiester glycosidase family protein [Cyanobacteria bacterium SIG31]|nr:phosphodiester glycosidase family protein [Cyanobacteria bacterium SIG31]
MKRIFLTILTLLLFNPVQAAINVEYNNGVYHFVLTGEKIKKQIAFVSSTNLITNKEAHNNSDSKLTINTGFFDPKNQKTISYIVNDYQTVEDPLFNENLMMNPVLRRNLKSIVNRTEFRILDCDNKLKYEIAQHNSKIDFMCSIKTSAQGGPQLLPNLRLEEEFFVVKDVDGNVIRESASVLHKTPRTLIGIKNLPKGEQEVHIFIVTNETPMDIYEARNLCASYGLDSAMAFDGGSSTSMNYKKMQVVSTQDSGDTGRALKSFMIIKKK